jgi:hypothetical protein
MFEYYHPPIRVGNQAFIWPNGAVDRSDRVHAVASHDAMGATQPFAYTRSNNGGTTWEAMQIVDTLTTISPIVVASPVSDKVAIIYAHPTDTANQIENDIYYIPSNDGITWNWNNKINVTGYGQGDSVFASGDLDAVFDHNDRLHIAWVATRISGNAPIGPVYLFQYVDDPGIIVELTRFDTDIQDSCDSGIENVSLAASPGGDIYTAYTRFDGVDCSSYGEANGELIAQRSFDGGLTWGLPTNITNTPSAGCEVPDCRSEIFPSMAEWADDYLHIFYVGYRGLNAPYHLMLYYACPVASIGVPESEPLPSDFTLHQNYPNPFNVGTSIKFVLQYDAVVQLEIFDIIGARVETLIDGPLKAGRHYCGWNADGLASGIYFYQLRVGDEGQIKRMVLLK